MNNLFEAIDSLFESENEAVLNKALNENDNIVDESTEVSEDTLNEAEYTPNARKCIDAANLLGQIDLNDIEDAAKIKDQINKLFDKLIKLAPKLNKKEQKEAEEASKHNEEVDDEFVKNTSDYKTRDELMRDSGVEFASPEAHKTILKKASDAAKAIKDSKEK